VLAAADADEAIRISREHAGSVDVLLTDVVIPGLSGRVLAQRLLKSRPGLRVVYMSGYTDDAIVRHGTLEAGIPLLAKPFTKAELLQKMQEVLASGRSGDAGPDQDTASGEPESGAQFDQAALHRVDPELRAELRRAVVAARYGEACRIIDHVRATEPQLATELRRLVDDFEYGSIRDLLDCPERNRL
jgi:CheY-like chemotaxis protein